MKKIFLAIIIASSLLLCGCESKEDIEKYEHGISLIEQKEWERATNTFTELGDFRDSKDKLTEITYLENIETIESDIKYPTLSEDNIKKAFNNLVNIIDYKDTKEIINNYISTMESAIDEERNVKNSEQKDYSNTTFSYLEILSDLAYKDEYKEELNTYICDVSKQALNEGFYIYLFTSKYKYGTCEDTEGFKDNKYFKMVDKSWQIIINKNRFSSDSHFIQFLTTNAMTYEDTYISIYGQVPLNYSYWYKIYNNAIYGKERKSDKYKKVFTISSVNDKTLKLKEIKKALEAM